MKLARYGYDVIITALLIALGLFIGGLFVGLLAVKLLMFAVAAFIVAFTLYFFRDPERLLPDGVDDGSVVVSPADGRVFIIRDVEHEEFVGGPATQIAIFLSPLNVHVNRIPVSGRVEHVGYFKGKFEAAFKEKSDLNERTHIGIANDRMRLLMKQIAGAVARRIVYEIEEGDEVIVGERFGMIKFGSRTDVFVPAGAIVEVKEGDIVSGGLTVLCRLPERG